MSRRVISSSRAVPLKTLHLERKLQNAADEQCGRTLAAELENGLGPPFRNRTPPPPASLHRPALTHHLLPHTPSALRRRQRREPAPERRSQRRSESCVSIHLGWHDNRDHENSSGQAGNEGTAGDDSRPHGMEETCGCGAWRPYRQSEERC